MTVQIVFILIGAYLFVGNGVLGIGKNRNRAQRFSKLVGEVPARVIYCVIGIALIVYGAIAMTNPDILPA